MPDESKPAAWKTLIGPWLLRLAVVLAAAGIGAVAQWLGVPVPPPVYVEVEKRVEVPAAAPPPAMVGGWIADPDEVDAVVAAMVGPKVFSDTPAGKTQEALPPFVYGWKAFQILSGKMPPIKNQKQVGSCVSFGTNTAVERTLANETLRRKGTVGEWSRFAEEATYGGSRVEIGGGRLRGDGSVGAWAAKFVTTYGMVPRLKYDQADLTIYSESLCRQWGSQGVPTEFEAVSRKYPVKSAVQVKVWEEAKTAMAQGYFIAVCSNQGFANTRDANGVARPSGSWAHCMALDGYHTEAGKEYGHITNSWDTTWISGPVGWGEPNADGFWADWRTVDSMLKQGDSWAFSGITGFPARAPLPWFIRAEPRQFDQLAGVHRHRQIGTTSLSELAW